MDKAGPVWRQTGLLPVLNELNRFSEKNKKNKTALLQLNDNMVRILEYIHRAVAIYTVTN